MSPSPLAEQQARFAAAIALRDETAVERELFVGPPGRVRNLIGIYRGNARANWTKALESAYPVVRQLVGEEFFHGLAREYARAEPSASGDLNLFGHVFAQFLATFPPARALPYLPDVARLEWAVHRAFYAADATPLSLDGCAAIREDQLGALHFRLAPACAVVPSRFPIVRVWVVHQPGYAGEIAVDLAAGGEVAFVYRPGFRVEVAALEAGEAVFLGQCVAGQALGAALDAALTANAGFDLQAVLLRWLQAGAIAGLDVV